MSKIIMLPNFPDKRFMLMFDRLNALTKAEIQSIVDNIDIILFDEFNFHRGRFCPIGVALGCHTMDDPTNEKVKAKIAERFQPANMLKGVPGDFYHGSDEERKADLLWLCEFLLSVVEP